MKWMELTKRRYASFIILCVFFFQAEDGIRDRNVTGVQTCALPIYSTLTIQGSAGTNEDAIKYSWNYALLLAEGPSERSMVPAPIYRGMKEGKLVRFERSEEHTSELQSRFDLVCRLLLEKKKQNKYK